MLRVITLLALASGAVKKPTDSTQECSVLTPAVMDDLLKYCQSDSVDATNKPAIRVGKSEGQVVPLSCLSDPTQCEREMAEWDLFLTQQADKVSQLEQYRTDLHNAYQNWIKEFTFKINQLTDHLKNDDDITNLQTLFTELKLLKYLHMRAEIVAQHNLGNCGEQSAFSAIKLLEQSQKEDVAIRIQLVQVVANPTRPNDQNEIVDHHFLLIDSDARVVNIQNNEKQTQEYLKKLKTAPKPGFICDAWNQGLYAPLSEDKSQLYDTNWHSITVRDVSFDFNKLKLLALPLQKAFYDEFTQMGMYQTETLTGEYCQANRIPANNKPFIRVGVKNDAFVPVSCFTDPQKCNSDQNRWGYFLQQSGPKANELTQHRKKQHEALQKWKKEIKSELQKKVDLEKNDEIFALFEQLAQLKEYYMDSTSVTERNLGGCGEQSAFTALKLLTQAQKFNLNLKITVVDLHTTKESPGFNIKNHRFLLINSDAPDVNIANNAKETQTYLRSLKTLQKSGKMCDPWNDGLFVPLNADPTHMLEKSWDGVKTKTLEFDFKKLSTLPRTVATLFCDELSKMNLSENRDKTCENLVSTAKTLRND